MTACIQPVWSRGMGAGCAVRGTCGIGATFFAGHEAVQRGADGDARELHVLSQCCSVASFSLQAMRRAARS